MNAKRNIFIAFILNFVFSIFELFGGIITGSISIASDAIHDFGDAISIGLSYFLEKISNKKPNEKYSFGYARFSNLAGFITTFILLIGSFIVIYNAILRIINPIPINYDGMFLFAVVGLIVNLFATYFTHGGKSLNMKAVNLHMLEDVFGWLVVLISAIILRFTNFYIIDPILSIILAVVIIVNCFNNLKQILDIFLIKTPKNINVKEILRHVKDIKGVIDVHHIHIWTLDGEIICATMHVVTKHYDMALKNAVKEELAEHGITHVTLELEQHEEDCKEKGCEIKKSACHCHHHHH